MTNTPPKKIIYLFPDDESEAEAPTASDKEVAEGPRKLDLPPPGVRLQAKGSDEDDTPITDLYATAQVAKLLDISESRLRSWSRNGLIEPSVRRGRRRYYTFQDLVCVRAAAGLINNGLNSRQLGRALRALQTRLPEQPPSLSGLRLSQEGSAVVVGDSDARFEAETGQLLLDFVVDELRKQVVELVQPRQKPGDVQRKKAFQKYLEGCRFEAAPEGHELAEQAYRQALELDPQLACAYTNLGNLRYRAGSVEDARALYEKALEVDAEQPEAQYNLAFLTYEEGNLDEAVMLFQGALDLDPDFADAHFNLGMALSEMGRTHEAATHFSAYLALEPSGPWAEIARRELSSS